MSNTKDKTEKESIISPDHYRKIILSNIKHDLTNPINAILGYSELIMDIVKEEDNKALDRDIHAIHESGSAILTHINEIFSNSSDNTDDHIGDIINNTELQFILRTPLSTIIGLTEMTIREFEFDAYSLTEINLLEVKDSMEKIELAGKRLFK